MIYGNTYTPYKKVDATYDSFRLSYTSELMPGELVLALYKGTKFIHAQYTKRRPIQKSLFRDIFRKFGIFAK